MDKTPSTDMTLINVIKDTLPIKCMLGINSYSSNFANHIKDFKRSYLLELEEKNRQLAKNHFQELNHIKILDWKAKETFHKLFSILSHIPTLYFLNIPANPTHEESACSLLSILAAMSQIHSHSIIIIHNAKIQTCPTTDINHLLESLTKLNKNHHFLVMHGLFIFCPNTFIPEVNLENQKYKHQLTNLQALYQSSLDSLKERDAYIHYLTQGFIKKSLKYSKYLAHKIYNLIIPANKIKLGKLHHHQPRKLHIPKNYLKSKGLPKISIVTPSYNQGSYLEHTIKSVLSQRYPSLEYIIQDGGSKDNTRKILKEFSSQLKHWASKPDKGQANAINLGFQHATGDIMAYLNSDDLLLPGALHYIADYFVKNPNIDVVYGHRVLINEHGKETGRWILPRHNSRVLKWADYIPQETLFWRKSIWEKVGSKLDESFKFAMDWDLLLRFQEAGARFVRLPRFLGAFRVHSQQKTSGQIATLGEKEMKRIRQRIHNREVTQQEVEGATKFYIYKHLVYHFLYNIGLARY